MNKKTLPILLAVILLVCFFLPYITIGSDSASGLNIVFGKDGMDGISSSGRYLFISLLIPLSGLLILIGIVTNDSFTSSSFIYWLPLVGVLYIIVMLYLGATGAEGDSVSIDKFIGIFGYGLWITLVAALILPFSRSRI